MQKTIFKPVKLSLLIAFILPVLWINPAFCDNDSYLQMLEAEAKSSDHIQDNNQLNAQQFEAQNKRKKEFEVRLAKELPATFRTYRILSREDKLMVINTYFENKKNMPVATRLLFNLYFNIK